MNGYLKSSHGIVARRHKLTLSNAMRRDTMRYDAISRFSTVIARRAIRPILDRPSANSIKSHVVTT
jgi:hypothetical protein